jgi:hypothetical protein
MADADRNGRVAEEALAIARELVAAIRPLVAGIIVSGSGGTVGTALNILGVTSATWPEARSATRAVEAGRASVAPA